VRPDQRAIFFFLSDGPAGMSKRSGSTTCFSGTRKGVLTNRVNTPKGCDLERPGHFANSFFGLFRDFSRQNPEK
jgi:hypothetical protein